jgi:hypothetical protein
MNLIGRLPLNGRITSSYGEDLWGASSETGQCGRFFYFARRF